MPRGLTPSISSRKCVPVHGIVGTMIMCRYASMTLDCLILSGSMNIHAWMHFHARRNLSPCGISIQPSLFTTSPPEMFLKSLAPFTWHLLPWMLDATFPKYIIPLLPRFLGQGDVRSGDAWGGTQDCAILIGLYSHLNAPLIFSALRLSCVAGIA